VKVVSGTWATASLSAFLLKVVLEEKLGFPTLLISDYDDMFNDTESVIEGLARGDAHLYPEVRSGCMPQVLRPLLLLSDRHVRGLAFAGRFGFLKRGKSSFAAHKRGRCVLLLSWNWITPVLLPVCTVRERLLLLR
jgi:hypothetical protein